MGLLDDFSGFAATPQGQGLLTAVFSGLAGARKGQPLNTLGAAGLGGLQGYAQAQTRQSDLANQQTAQKLAQIQLQQAQQQQQDQTDVRGLAQQFYKAPTMTPDQVNAAPGQAGPTNARAALIPQTQPSFDTQGFINAYMGKDPIKALALRGSLAKELPLNKVDVKDYTPDSVAKFAQTNNYADLVPRNKLENVNGVWADPYSGRNVSVGPQDLNKPMMYDPNGNPVANTPFQKYEIGKARAGSTQITVDAAPKAFWSDFGKQASDKLFSERDAAQSAAGTLQSIGEIRKAVQGGAYQGAGADLKLGSAKALQALGFQIDPKAVANSEMFNAQANNFVLEKIKTLGANPSNADREFIEKTVPRLQTDPSALPLLLNYMEQKARAQVSGFNSKIRGVQQRGGADFMPYSLEIPESSGSGEWSITPLGK